MCAPYCWCYQTTVLCWGLQQTCKHVFSFHGPRRQFTLVRVVNVVKRVDGVQGSRYLLELELRDTRGHLLRVSNYIYALTRHSRRRSKDFGYHPAKPQMVLCNPVGFRWYPATTVHFIVPGTPTFDPACHSLLFDIRLFSKELCCCEPLLENWGINAENPSACLWKSRSWLIHNMSSVSCVCYTRNHRAVISICVTPREALLYMLTGSVSWLCDQFCRLWSVSRIAHGAASYVEMKQVMICDKKVEQRRTWTT